MSVKGKLQRMKGYMNTETSNRELPSLERPKVHSDSTFPFPHEDKWNRMGFRLHSFEGEYSLIRKRTYPLAYKHGSSAFSEIFDVHEEWQRIKGEHPLSLKGIDVGDLLFFDTETTGLSSGAGTSIFLMGYSRIKEDRVEVVQHFMPGPESEASFFHGFLTDFEKDNQLVSYNGKAFDWPHVKSRHAFVRNEVPNLPLFGHFDLLHAARRLWKNELPSCRLSIVEEEKLSVKRVNETPGSLAPILYFEYLNHQDPEELEGIVKHHEWDVLSLIVLFTQISKRLLHMEPGLSHGEEHLQMGRWFEQAKNHDHAFVHYKEALKTKEQEASVKLGHLYKKQKDLQNAKRYYEESIKFNDETRAMREAYEELAKLTEHVEKDYQKALYYTARAIEVEKRVARMLRTAKPKIDTLVKRKTRLETKLDKRSGFRD